MKEKELFPLGQRRDGSYYTRIVFCDKTENDPMFWVNNLIDDDLCRNGGTWGANTSTSANAVLDFFGETMTVSKLRVYKNVGATISVLEELAKHVHFYYSNDDEVLNLKSKDDDIQSVQWTKFATMETIKEVGWQEIVLENPIEAKYIRIELDDNFCKRDDSFIPWMEINEIKIY